MLFWCSVMSWSSPKTAKQAMFGLPSGTLTTQMLPPDSRMHRALLFIAEMMGLPWKKPRLSPSPGQVKSSARQRTRSMGLRSHCPDVGQEMQTLPGMSWQALSISFLLLSSSAYSCTTTSSRIIEPAEKRKNSKAYSKAWDMKMTGYCTRKSMISSILRDGRE